MITLPRETSSTSPLPSRLTEPHAQLVADLTQGALSAPDISSAVKPALEALTERTAAVGVSYFQLSNGMFRARSTSGELPRGLITAYGLPGDTPLMRALETTRTPLFFGDTHAALETAGLPDSGAASLAAVPVLGRDGTLQGAFLMYTFKAHSWNQRERDLFSAVTTTLAPLTARLVAEEQKSVKRAKALHAREGAIKALGVAVEGRDSETKGHTDRVTDLTLRVGAALSLDAVKLGALRWGAYLHDLGKVATPNAILHKPGKLSASEWEVMRRHVEAGYKVARQLTFLPEATLETIRYHHERWDGGGYPHGLAKADIPLSARIFSACDVYDTLTSVRPYKTAWSHEDALTELQLQAGRQFDPAVVQAFVSLCGPGGGL